MHYPLSRQGCYFWCIRATLRKFLKIKMPVKLQKFLKWWQLNGHGTVVAFAQDTFLAILNINGYFQTLTSAILPSFVCIGGVAPRAFHVGIVAFGIPAVIVVAESFAWIIFGFPGMYVWRVRHPVLALPPTHCC